MKYSTEVLLNDLYTQTEKNLNTAISEWQQMPNIRMMAQPGVDRWSAIQCLEHLNSYGRYYLPAIEKAISRSTQNKPVASFTSGLIGNYFYKLMLPANDGSLKKKMKSPKDHVPIKLLDPTKVLNEFISQQELIGQLLTRAQFINISKARVGISIAPFIKLKLGDVFLFLVAHINRHMLQAGNALQQSCNDHVAVIGNTTKREENLLS
ncbi:MAG: DinB family protein [Ferruginibacter sp.]